MQTGLRPRGNGVRLSRDQPPLRPFAVLFPGGKRRELPNLVLILAISGAKTHGGFLFRRAPVHFQKEEEKMSVLSKLASAHDRKDEEPNKDLGKELVENHDIEGTREIADNLWDKDKRVQTDCLSVLEQVGLLEPELIENYAADFIEIIFSKDNRLVWAAMINLALIADRKPQEIFERYEDIIKVIEKGSVITQDNGIKTLAKVASTSAKYNKVIMPYLMEQLRSCRSKSVPQYAESIRIAVNLDNKDQYLSILNERFEMMSAAQQKRVKKIIKTF